MKSEKKKKLWLEIVSKKVFITIWHPHQFYFESMKIGSLQWSLRAYCKIILVDKEIEHFPGSVKNKVFGYGPIGIRM